MDEEKLSRLVLKYARQNVAYENILNYMFTQKAVRLDSFGLQLDINKRMGENRKIISKYINEYEENNNE